MKIGNKVDLVPFFCQSFSQLGSYYATTAKGRITYNTYFHALLILVVLIKALHGLINFVHDTGTSTKPDKLCVVRIRMHTV